MSRISGEGPCGLNSKRSSFPERGDNFRTLAPEAVADLTATWPDLEARLAQMAWRLVHRDLWQ